MIKYLGVHLDSTLSMEHHIQTKCASAIYNIRKLRQIRPFIDIDTAKMLASSLVLSHLDYANVVLSGLPSKCIGKLQRVQNWAAKVVLCRSKSDSSKEALKQLHWLPICQRIDFKDCCLVFKCLKGTAPSYLKDLIKVRSYARSTCAATSDDIELVVPFVRKSIFAERGFSVRGPKLWNSLPSNVKSSDNIFSFKRQLKTHLFTTCNQE